VALTAAPDAILYLPGMGDYDRSDAAALTFAERLAAALDHGAATAGAAFRVKSRVEGSREGLGERQLLVCGIERVEADGTERSVLDIYRVDYHDALMQDYEERSSLSRGLVTAFEALKGSCRIVAALVPRQGVGRLRLLQVLMAFAFWMSLLLYFVLLLASFAGAFVEGLEYITKSPKSSALGSIQWFFDQHAGFSQAVVTAALGLAALTSLIPEKYKAEVVRMGARYVRLSTYLSTNNQRSAIVGRFHAVLEHVVETGRYGRVHVLGYSFGSIVALDALFPPPAHEKVKFPRLAHVNKLITVGCPFDFIRTLWPQYFANRGEHSIAPEHWINVYTPPDALGSNFRDDENLDEATVGLGGRLPENLVYERGKFGLLDALSFLAIRSHGIYWKPDNDPLDQGCLRDTMAVAFSQEPILE